MLLGTLGASLLGDILTSLEINRAGEGIVTAGYGKKHYQTQSRFNGVYSRNNFKKIKDGAHVVNLDEYSDNGTHWITLYI